MNSGLALCCSRREWELLVGYIGYVSSHIYNKRKKEDGRKPRKVVRKVTAG